MGDGVVKKVEAVLSLQLSAEGQRRQREGDEARRRAAAEQQRLFDEMMERYRAAAEAGDTTAMVAIGALYDEGIGLPKSREQAIAWYRKAADAGNKRGDFRLSERYRRSSQDPDVIAVDRMLGLPEWPVR
jgi:TPR repeat protein